MKPSRFVGILEKMKICLFHQHSAIILIFLDMDWPFELWSTWQFVTMGHLRIELSKPPIVQKLAWKGPRKTAIRSNLCLSRKGVWKFRKKVENFIFNSRVKLELIKENGIQTTNVAKSSILFARLNLWVHARSVGSCLKAIVILLILFVKFLGILQKILAKPSERRFWRFWKNS